MLSSFSTQQNYSIAFFGDSLTQMADWDGYLDRRDVYVYAKNGDITANMKKNVDHIIQANPKICFMMGGINDIAKGIPVDDVFANLRHMAVKMKSWGIIPVVQSTLYIQADEGGFAKWNEKVEPLNKQLEAYCAKNAIEYLDLNTILAANKSLKSDYTSDGVHLNQYGYMLWTNEIKKILTKYSI